MLVRVDAAKPEDLWEVSEVRRRCGGRQVDGRHHLTRDGGLDPHSASRRADGTDLTRGTQR